MENSFLAPTKQVQSSLGIKEHFYFFLYIFLCKMIF